MGYLATATTRTITTTTTNDAKWCVQGILLVPQIEHTATTTTTTTTINDAKLCDQRILLAHLCVMIVNAKLPKMLARLLYLLNCFFIFLALSVKQNTKFSLFCAIISEHRNKGIATVPNALVFTSSFFTVKLSWNEPRRIFFVWFVFYGTDAWIRTKGLFTFREHF